MFLHTPLTVIERSGHEVKEFPEPNSDEIKGVDATLSEGWIDLKVQNDTDCTFQITVTFDGEKIYGTMFVDKQLKVFYKAVNGDIQYVRESGEIYEYVKVERTEIDANSGKIIGQIPLYTNKCKICYPLPRTQKLALPDEQESVLNEIKSGYQTYLANKETESAQKAKFALLAKQIGMIIWGRIYTYPP